VALAASAAGCAGTARREGERRVRSFTHQSLQAEIEWFDGQNKLPGQLLFLKPFNAWVNIKGRAGLYVRELRVALVRPEWRGAVELRQVHPFENEPMFRYLDRLLAWARKNYEVESVDGPLIAGRRSVQLTLKPRAGAKPPALATITDRVERYWLDAEMSFPLRYALLGPEGQELYSWELRKLQFDTNPGAGSFLFFPSEGMYSLPLYLPVERVAMNSKVGVPALSLEQAKAELGYPLFALEAPFALRSVTVYSNRPLSDYKDKDLGGFAYLLQAPLADPEQAAIELKREGDTWREPRRERLVKGQGLGPDNPGLHTLQAGSRSVTYDNLWGIKAFGWTENGHAMTLLTTADLRAALAAIAAGRFR
jgi:hypothetical protein